VQRNRFYQTSDYTRHFAVAEKEWRSPFYRDYARILHSPSFRRLQGKTQLFPGLESDFFRNRLTHSLEVAQIARGIAEYLNQSLQKKVITRAYKIDTDLVQCAALAHDMGHPPFGHAGERTLNTLMHDYGGFESNAQNFRVLTRLEKKLESESSESHPWYTHKWYDDRGNELSCGLNLCMRTLSSILKYDSLVWGKPAPTGKSSSKPHKGYYASESELIKSIKKAVTGTTKIKPFKTIECQIMDIADDIAYSTYDLEDALKGGIITLLDLLVIRDEILDDVVIDLRKNGLEASHQDVQRIAAAIFDLPENELLKLAASKTYNVDGFSRIELTSRLVKEAIESVSIDLNMENPPLSKISMKPEIQTRVIVFKKLVYGLIINSNRDKILSSRAERIISEIFTALSGDKGSELLPEDFKEKIAQTAGKKQAYYRVIADFIASMTDRYAIEFYSRLTSDDFHSVFRPYD
jgi:dGTPase